MAKVIREFYATIANRISILRYWKRQRLKLENSFKIYKDDHVNEFFWCSCLLGGILKTKKVTQTFKRIWLICNISSIITMLTLNAVCLIWYEEKNAATLVKFSKPTFAIIWLCCGQALVNLNTDIIENYIDKMDKRIESVSFDEQGLNFDSKMSKIEILASFGPSLFFVTGLLGKYLLPDFKILNEILCFHYPFNDDFQTLPTIVLTIISFIQFLTTLPCSIGLYCLLKLMKVFIVMNKRMFDFYLKQIANIGSTTLQQMESSHNQELLMEQNEATQGNRSSEDFIRQRNTIEENFEKEMAYSSKQIWSFIQIQLTLRTMFENGCTASLFVLYAHSIPFAGKLLWIIHHPEYITVAILNACLFFSILVYLFYKLCCIGSQTADMLDQFPIEVYSTPWYMMSKKTRRIIYIILNQFLDSLYSNGSVFYSILERAK